MGGLWAIWGRLGDGRSVLRSRVARIDTLTDVRFIVVVT